MYIKDSEKQHKYTGKKIWKQGTEEILKLLFGRQIFARQSSHSISNTENYEKYFTLNVPPYRLSIHEFKSLFEQKGDEEKIVRKWIDDGKYYSSIMNKFKNCQIKSYDESHLEAFFKGVLTYGFVLAEKNIDFERDVQSLLDINCIELQRCDKAKQLIYQWFGEKIRMQDRIVVLTKLLNRLYAYTEYYEDSSYSVNHSILISNDNIENLLQEAISCYLNCHSEVTSIDIFNEKTEIGIIFKNCCVKTIVYEEDYENTKWKNVAIEVVIDHFSNLPKLPFKDINEAYNNMYMDALRGFDYYDPDDVDCYANLQEQRDYNLIAYFGSNNDDIIRLKRSISDISEMNKLDTEMDSKMAVRGEVDKKTNKGQKNKRKPKRNK